MLNSVLWQIGESSHDVRLDLFSVGFVFCTWECAPTDLL